MKPKFSLILLNPITFYFYVTRAKILYSENVSKAAKW